MPTLADIASLLGVEPIGGRPRGLELAGVASLADAGPADLSYLSTERRAREFRATRAGAVLIDRKLVPAEPAPGVALLPVDDAELAIARVLPLFAPPTPHPPPGIDPAARVAASADVHPAAAVGPFVVVGERVKIGAGCRLHPGVVLGDDVSLGDGCELFANVVVRERCTLGRRVILNAGVVIGTDGFGYRWGGERHEKVPHVGTVLIEDGVEIGSCSCVDRAKFSQTVIGRGTKIDNLVQIGHNVRTGPHCLIVANTAVAGSVTMGGGAILGGQTAVREHIAIGTGARTAACAGVIDDIAPGQTVSGIPALPQRQFLREQAALRRLPDLMVQVRKLQAEVERLKGERTGISPSPSGRGTGGTPPG